MSRHADVSEVLRIADRQLAEIRSGYERALHDRSLDLRVQVKNLMENFRSALDYMANDIYDHSCQAPRAAVGLPRPKVYFPYGRTEADVRSGVGRSLPNLETLSPDVYALLLGIQPFRSGDSWLYDLCVILNESKHDRLTPQERVETQAHTVESQYGSVTTVVNSPSVSVISTPGAVKLFGVPAQFSPGGIQTAPSASLTHRRTIWVGFTFSGTGIDTLALLDKAARQIPVLSEALYRLI
jgi:hypothetical protein